MSLALKHILRSGPRHSIQAGVGFAIKSSIVRKLEFLPKGINSRLMLLRLNLPHGRYATLISAHAPTLPASDACKEEFYEKLTTVIDSVPRRDKLLLLGDFNARIGRDYTSWCKVIGPHGVRKGNSYGILLLSTCTQYTLVITNTIFQQSNKYKTTNMDASTFTSLASSGLCNCATT